MPKKICVITVTRAEYGLMSTLMKKIKEDTEFILQILVSGAHLSPEFGLTYQEIINDNFKIDGKVEMLLSSDTAVGITKSMGIAMLGFAEHLERLQPDLVVLLGDRYETLAASTSCLIAKIPIIHLHGGELTMGAYDDAIRHAITKMSHLHCAATPTYQKRIIQMGENPSFVFHTGALALDRILNMTLLTKEELSERLNIHFRSKIFLITFHPETLESIKSEVLFKQLLHALENFSDTTFIFTYANADTDGRQINFLINDYCQNNANAYGFENLGQEKYYSLMKIADVVIGNSSSGIIETPYFNTPTVNIGNRQMGRITTRSVIDCECETASIIMAIETALSPAHLEIMHDMPLPYGSEPVADKIINIIKETDLTEYKRKVFWDIT